MLKDTAIGSELDQCRAEAQNFNANETQTLKNICEAIRSYQVKRLFCIRQQVRLTNSLGALVRWQLGWSLDKTEKEREKIRKDAEKIIKDIKADKADRNDPRVESVIPHYRDIEIALEPFNDRRKNLEKRMVDLAKLTPGAPFVEEVRGFGTLGLAVIIGESGDLSNYPNVAKLWKRLGWAPPEEYEEGVKSTGRKIPRRRKGELYGVVVEPLMKNNHGKYKALYDVKKAEYFDRFSSEEKPKAPKLHAHKLAMRVMLKELLKDLWVEWNDAKV